jgi:gas vesicle protein
MTESPDVIRSDIERTRAELGMDVDALADKVTPSKIVQRQGDKVRGAFGSLRDRLMGTAHDAGDVASDIAHGAGEVAHDVRVKAEGNPLAVGLIAFGVGLAAASLIPASSREKELATAAKEQAQPLMDEVAGVAKDVAANLNQPVHEAATAVKDRAAEAVETVKEEASGAAETVKDRAQTARENVSES